MSAIDEYNACFRRVLGAKEEELNDGYTFAGVDVWDSMAHMELISSLEDAFDVLFTPDEILHFGSYENGKKILSGYGVDFSK